MSDKAGAILLILVGVAGLWLWNSGRLGGVWAYLASPAGSVAIVSPPAGSGSGQVCTAP